MSLSFEGTGGPSMGLEAVRGPEAISVLVLDRALSYPSSSPSSPKLTPSSSSSSELSLSSIMSSSASSVSPFPLMVNAGICLNLGPVVLLALCLLAGVVLVGESPATIPKGLAEGRPEGAVLVGR